MQDDLPKSGTVGEPDADEWTSSRTAAGHGDLFGHLWLLYLQHTDYNHLVSHL